MMYRIAAIALIALLAQPVPAAPAADDELRHDPFRREIIRRAESDGAARVDPRQLPTVGAVVLAGERSLVKLQGEIIGIGESVDGYTLIAVDEEKVVLARGGERFELPLDQPPPARRRGEGDGR